MKINIDRIPIEGLNIVETRPPQWWSNFGELSDTGAESIEGEVQFDLAVQRMGSQIYVRGGIIATVAAQCARCLASVKTQVSAPVDVFMVPRRIGKREEEEEEEEGFETYEGENLDLAAHLRGQLALYVPLRFLCRPDCQGLCPRCGANLNTESCSCGNQTTDPRWAALKKLKF